MNHFDISELEISLLLEGIYQKYGYDFREYSKAHIKRRIMNRMVVSGTENISKFTKKYFTAK